MLRIIYSILLIVFVIQASTAQQKSVYKTTNYILNHDDGFSQIEVLEKNPNLTFNPKKEYFWYNEISGIKSTKGGAGGLLLHGILQIFDLNGNLIGETHYDLGVRTGTSKKWDAKGNLIGVAKYELGTRNYVKYQDEDGMWVENFGIPYTNGYRETISNGIDFNNVTTLVFERTIVKDLRWENIRYNKFNGNKIEKYYTNMLKKDVALGVYESYYENGKIKCKGQYHDNFFSVSDSEFGMRDGEWVWYDELGNITQTANYKFEMKHYENNKRKFIGSKYYNPESKDWEYYGEWIWYDSNGKISERKNFDSGDN